MPVVDGDLAGDEGAAACVAVVEDLEKVMASGIIQGGEPPVVEDEELGAG